MQADAIKYRDGWFIRGLPELESIQSNVISLNIDLSEAEWKEMGYKELKGVSIMERYAEKQSREIPPTYQASDIQKEFRNHFKLNEYSLKEWLREQA